MYHENNLHLTFVLYDGILNSVFSSMVLNPLLNQLAANKNLEITLISFERYTPDKETLMKLIPAHDRLHLILCRRLPFLGRLSLFFSYLQLRRLLTSIPSHHIIARGPLAGWVVLRTIYGLARLFNKEIQAFTPGVLPRVTIQARGLCAEEYRVTVVQKKPALFRLFYRPKYRLLRSIENMTYVTTQDTEFPTRLDVEAVSPALKDFLVRAFDADPSKIILNTTDAPEQVSTEQKNEWRHSIRTELGIPDNVLVYVYSGSAHAWQCLPEMVFFFFQKYKEDKNIFFLVLTTEPSEFTEFFKQTNMPKSHYRIMSINPNDTLKYLAACDAGLIFRKPDVINWVSRPTKLLEYQAAGLKIIHNFTIGMLTQQPQKETP